MCPICSIQLFYLSVVYEVMLDHNLNIWHIVISYLDVIYLFIAYLFTARIIGQV